VPLRIEIGPRDLDRKVVTLVTRLGQKNEAPRAPVVSSVALVLSDINRALSDRAASEIRGRVTAAGTLEQASAAVERGVAVVSWCHQRECADILEEKTGGSILGTDIGGNRLPEIPRPCIVCGKEGTPTLLARTF
jgi:prolyl-tRNA synthetase